jgi:HPt (histidine-containing phosphotransfer) domain-containing protein
MTSGEQIPRQETPVIDAERLRQNLSGDSALLGELVAILRDELSKDLTTIQSALDDRDSTTLERIAHRLKGSLRVFGASCSSQAERVEIDARNGSIDAARVLQLKSSLAAVAPALELILKQGGI